MPAHRATTRNNPYSDDYDGFEESRPQSDERPETMPRAYDRSGAGGPGAQGSDLRGSN